MNRFKVCKSAIGMALCLLAAGAARAELVTYSFSTGVLSGGQGAFCGTGPCAPHPYYGFASNAFVSGTFQYDAMAPVTTASVPGSGATQYGIRNIAPDFPSSYANLAGSVQGYNFSDARGITTVGNETFALTDFSTIPATTTIVDFLGLNTQSQTPMTGFDLGGYTLRNVRMFWIEGQRVPDLVPDFLANQNLPGVLPAFDGMLALDFAPLGSSLTAPTAAVFFNGLSVAPVPEPDTYAMLLAGLGLLAFHARRATRTARK